MGLWGWPIRTGPSVQGGLASRPWTLGAQSVIPAVSRTGAQLLQKRSISSQDYWAAGLEGGGMKRKLILQSELREAIARLSQHCTKDEKLGQRLSEAEFGALLDGLASDPCTVKGFGPGEEEGLLPEDGRRRMLIEQRTMVRDRNMAVLELLRGSQGDFERRGMNGNLWESWVGEWTELLYCLGAHDSDEDLIGAGALHVVRKLLPGGEASLEDRRELARSAPILRRILDAYGGLTFPGFFMQTLHLLYLLTLLARGLTGFAGEGRLGWRLGRDEEGVSLHPLPKGHSFRAEQDALAWYDFPGWEQYRSLPHFSNLEHPDGRSKSSEEFKCTSGKTVGKWDSENVPGLIKGSGKATKKGAVAQRPNRSRGAFVFCCPHRAIYGYHVMLRGESPRDAGFAGGKR
ncbi:hypothetical protein KFL_002150020 [Klebsormidium nitens]|uniref:Uncharacterized protein n=1 Tax=Klebsormidium nitens TaxID=105231 RepID=A0A1Y1I214_KLENI|nr:hypothetical protein KFL_002150020 [Klebsormidium nitens]|eukprot:GAQ84965.1 hypothetical protein KFL_002150020 [Klebsormidium nitens]